MKVYKRYQQYKFEYPDEMEKILNYLKQHGEILVDAQVIETYYYYFSDEKYCAGWMSVSDEILEEFADWLDTRDLW